MANPELINSDFTQLGDICASASYGTVIEYFSNGKILIEHVLGRYVDRFDVFPPSPKVYYFREKHELICKHFHGYCGKRNMRGFDFIKQFHDGNELKTKEYCRILDSKASLEEIDNNSKDLIRDYLINHDALAIVTFKVRVGGEVQIGKYHAVTIGFDPTKKHFIYKDPNIPRYQVGDILSQELITEYIVFCK